MFDYKGVIRIDGKELRLSRIFVICQKYFKCAYRISFRASSFKIYFNDLFYHTDWTYVNTFANDTILCSSVFYQFYFYIETIQLIYANQLTGFYMGVTLTWFRLNILINRKWIFRSIKHKLIFFQNSVTASTWQLNSLNYFISTIWQIEPSEKLHITCWIF